MQDFSGITKSQQEISLSELVSFVADSKWMILPVVLTMAIAGFLLGTYNKTYVSNVSIHSNNATSFTDIEKSISAFSYKRFTRSFLSEAVVTAHLRKKLSSTSVVSQTFDPIYDTDAILIGINVSVKAKDIDTAKSAAEILSDYVIDGMACLSYSNFVISQKVRITDTEREAERKIVAGRKKLEEYQRKDLKLKSLLNSSINGGQISHGNWTGNPAYLPISSQRIGLQILAYDVDQQIDDLSLDLRQLALRQEFYSRVQAELKAIQSGALLNDLLTRALNLTFQHRDLKESWVAEVFEELNDENSTMLADLDDDFGKDDISIIAQSRLRPMLLSFAGAVLGFVLSFLALCATRWNGEK